MKQYIINIIANNKILLI